MVVKNLESAANTSQVQLKDESLNKLINSN